MKKRAWGFILSVMMAASALTGCSGGQKEAAGEAAAKAAESQENKDSEAAKETAGNEPAAAETDWPKNPIQIIVGANAGGGIDTAARLIAKYMEKELGQSMVVSNVAGGAGSIASNQVKDSKSDGYTMLMRKVQMCGLLYYDPGDYGAIPDGNQEGEKQYFGREGGCSGVFLLPYLSGIRGGRCAVLRGADICSQYAGTGFVKLY